MRSSLMFLMLGCVLLLSLSGCSSGSGDATEVDPTVDPTGAGGDLTTSGSGAGGDSSGTAGSTSGSTGGGSTDSGTAKGGSANGGSNSPGTGGTVMVAVDSGPPMPSSGCGMDPVLAPKNANNTGWPYFDVPKPPTAMPPKGQVPALTVNGKLRVFSVYVPATYDKNHPYPVYFSFHGCGGGSSPTSYIASSKEKGIIVAPQGLAGSCGGSTTGWLSAKNSEDYQFFDKMVEYLETGFCVDKSKIYASGHSHGAYFVGNLGCWRGDVLRGIDPQSGGPATMTDCVGKVAYIGLHHEMDGSVKFTDGIALRDQFAKANHCKTTTTPMSQAPCVQLDGCDPGYPVAWCPITGPMIFNNPPNPPQDVGPHNVWAWGPTGDVMWNFFFTLPAK